MSKLFCLFYAVLAFWYAYQQFWFPAIFWILVAIYYKME